VNDDERGKEDHVSTRDARSEPLSPHSLGAQESDGAQEPEIVGPNEIALSDGTRVILRETSGYDDEVNEKLLGRFGYALVGMGPASFGRAMALLSIESIDGEPRLRPRTKRDLDELLLRFKSRDIIKIIRLYNEINGMQDGSTDEETFR
jgi:hypothetical protein